jgi:hypothetical protein
MRLLPLLLLSACAVGTPPAIGARPGANPSRAPAGFWDHWGDGRGELAGYALVQPRYGELRRGEAVLVTVTEDFRPDAYVKAERGQRDAFPVVKLNEARDFTTGLYDYNTMLSAFVPLDGRLSRGLPVKATFSSQEWCGHTWDGLTVRGDSARHVWHSYFDGEADGDETIDVPAGAIVGDALPLLVRDLAGDFVKPGDARTVPYWPRSIDTRFAHEPPSWRQATLSREAQPRTIEVPAGTFEVSRTTLAVDGRTGHWDVEVAAPHRLIAWAWSDGEAGALTGVVRTPYWQKNHEGDEVLRSQLGLPSGG